MECLFDQCVKCDLPERCLRLKIGQSCYDKKAEKIKPQFINNKVLDPDGGELLQVHRAKYHFRLFAGGRFVADYETEEQALDVKSFIDEILLSAYNEAGA